MSAEASKIKKEETKDSATIEILMPLEEAVATETSEEVTGVALEVAEGETMVAATAVK